MTLSPALKEKIDQLVSTHDVLLFMKGNKHFPQCGFSARVVSLLKETGVPFETVNVLSDPEIREGIKEYSEWPTIPQLYVKKEFVGGCDIVTDMFQSGELHTMLGAKKEAISPPSLTLTESAQVALLAAKNQDGSTSDVLRIEISDDYRYSLSFDAPQKGDVVVNFGELPVHFDGASAKRAQGMKIDFVETKEGGAFRIENPNEPAKVKPLSVQELAKMVEEKEAFALYDVRGEGERDVAKLAFAKPMNDMEIRALPKDTKLVFHCHHGMRSRAMAERFLQEGFTRVYNLEGGIDAWSLHIDPNLARY